MVKKIRVRNHGVKGLLAGISVLLIGFGVHFCLWTFTEYGNTDLPGLFYYRAAVIGDALCLPLLTGSLVAYVSLGGSVTNRKQRNISIIIGCGSALIGIGYQASWLIRDDTKLNWTIPKQHYFNFPGWYHAFFFVAMFFCLGMLFTQFFIIKMREPVNEFSPSKMILQTLIWFSMSFFLFMLYLDNRANNSNYLHVLRITLLHCIGTSIVFYGSARRTVVISRYKYEISSVCTGFFTAFALGVIQYNGLRTDYLNIVSCILLMVVLIVPDVNNKGRMILYYLMTAVPAVLLEAAISSVISTETSTAALFQSSYRGVFYNVLDFLIMAVIVPCVIASSQDDPSDLRVKRKSIFSAVRFLVGISFLMIIFTLSEVDIDADVFEVIVNLIFAAAIPQYISATFSMVKKEENNKSSDPRDAESITRVQQTFYFIYLMLYFGGVVLITHTLLNDIQITDGNEFKINYSGLPCIFLLIVTAIGLSKKQNKSKTATNPNRFSLVLLSIEYLLLTIGIVLMFEIRWSFFSELPIIDLCMLTFADVSVFCFGYVISNAYVNNICSIRMIDVTSFEKITRSVIFCGVFLSTTVCACIFFKYKSIFAFFVVVLVVSIAAVVLPGVMAMHFAPETEQPQYVKNTQTGGVMQDGFLFSVEMALSLLATVALSVLLGKTIPAFKPFATNINDTYKYASSLILFLSLANLPLEFCLENNIEFYKHTEEEITEQRKESADGRDRKREDCFLDALKRHLRLQNIGALLIAFPFSLVTAVKLVSDFIMSEEERIKDVFMM
jgi:hypothetical protein